MTDFDINDSAITNLVRHIYGLRIEFDPNRPKNAVRALCADLPILDVAQKYEVASLISLIESRIVRRFGNASNNPVELTALLSAVYKWSEGKHCKFVAKLCLQHFQALMEDEEFTDLLLGSPQLAADLLEEAMEGYPHVAIGLAKRILETEPRKAQQLVKDGIKEQPTLAADLLSEFFLIAGIKDAPNMRNREADL